MHILAQIPNDLLGSVITFSFFAIMFVVISFLDAQAKGGWSSFAKRYPAQTRPAGKAYSVPSWTYCNVHWNARGVRVIFTDAGIYFSMLFYRRLAHPPFLVPWESVKGIKKERRLLGEYSVLEIEDAAGKIRLDLSRELEHVLARYQKAA
jgi:succinate dehydrogenase/fumarate reductase cytochrome b subunit